MLKKLKKIVASLLFVTSPILGVIACTSSNSQSVYSIHLDSYYKHAPYWKSVIFAIEKKFSKLGISKFKIKYTQQDSEAFTKDKILQLGFTDSNVPDIFKLEYGDISTFNNQRILMKFDDQMQKELNLNSSEENFLESWGSKGVDEAIKRKEYDRTGKKTKNIVVVGMPYSISSSVLMVRNGIKNGKLKKKITPENVIDPNTIEQINGIEFYDTEASASANASNFTPEARFIPKHYEEMLKYTKKQLANQSSNNVVKDQYDKHVYIVVKDTNLLGNNIKAGKIIRWDQDIGGYVVVQKIYKTKEALEAAFGGPINSNSNLEYLKTIVPTFFSRNDLWSELGQFLGVAIENDKADNGKRHTFFWKTTENASSASDWKHLFSEKNNRGAKKVWRYFYDFMKVQSEYDKSWFDPDQAIDTSFYNLSHGSRTFPITGIWDLGIVEKKYAMYVLNINTDEEMKKVIKASKTNKQAKLAIERILDKATKVLPLTDFIGYNNKKIEPFMQISSLVVNNRIATNPRKYNPSIKGKDGKTYSKKDAITMILKEFINPEHILSLLESEMVVPVNQDMIKATKNTDFETSLFNVNNFKEYVLAKGEILKSAPAGPKYQFYYVLQDWGQKAISTNRDLANTIQSSISTIEKNIAEQERAKADLGSVAGSSRIYNNANDNKRFRYWYNLIQNQMKQIISDQWELLKVSAKEFM